METTQITKDTRLCISLAERPSNVGTRFHNWLYRELGLDFVYKAGTTDDIGAAVAGIRALGIRGCGVSMPFKREVLPLVDVVDPSAARIGAANTIVNTNGVLHASNTDYLAVSALLALAPHGVPVVVVGSGGMARAIVAALREAGFDEVTVVARNETTGQELADEHGYAWRPDAGGLRPTVLINATPVGMAGGPAAEVLPVPGDVAAGAGYVMEVVANPVDTPLIRAARAARRRVTTGAQIMSLQAAAQFALYTGVRPTPEQIDRATAFARAE